MQTIRGGRPEIPELTDERLAELAARIEPLVADECGDLHRIEPVDLRRHSFLWDPKLREPVGELIEVARVETVHTCGYIGFFKPSVCEVLAAIPAALLDQVSWFKIMEGSAVPYASGDGHRAQAILYRNKAAPC
jgi:hypothetical protein